MFLAEKLQRLADELAVFDDPQERLSHLVDRAKRMPPLAPAERTDANRVPGCVSVVWLIAESRDGRGCFRSDAESPVVRALVIFLCEFFNGAPLAEIASASIEPLDALDLTRHLSPTRRNGLTAVRNAIIAFARREPTAPRAAS